MRSAHRLALGPDVGGLRQSGPDPGDGGAYYLPRLVGTSKALELLLTGDFVTADEAHRIGMVNRVVDPEDLAEATTALAAQIAASPPVTVRMIKARHLSVGRHRPADRAGPDLVALRGRRGDRGRAAEALAAMKDKRPRSSAAGRPTTRRPASPAETASRKADQMTPTAHTADEAEPRVFDSWISLPYAPGEVTPDPSVVARFKRSDSSSEGGETMADVVAEMDRLGISGGVLTKYPRDITPPFVNGIQSSEAVVQRV